MPLKIRPEVPEDRTAVFEINRMAFGRDDEAQLVDRLRDDGDVVLSLVAVDGGEIVGHVLFSPLVVHTASKPVAAVALAPIAVLPAHQRQGIGAQLIRHGLSMLTDAGHRIVTVLGHPEYYPRFGFTPEAARDLEVPFAGPAWMAQELVPGSLDGVSGRVEYPQAFGIGR